MKKLLIIIALLASTLFPLTTNALDPVAGPQGLLSDLSPGCATTGNCGYCDIIGVVNNIIKVVLGVVGSIALAVFVYAGIKLVIQGLNPSGKSGLAEAGKLAQGAIIGLAAVFFSYFIVNFILNILLSPTGGTIDKPTQLFGTGWANYCEGIKPEEFGPPRPAVIDQSPPTLGK